jgi:hypothetical protein
MNVDERRMFIFPGQEQEYVQPNMVLHLPKLPADPGMTWGPRAAGGTGFAAEKMYENVICIDILQSATHQPFFVNVVRGRRGKLVGPCWIRLISGHPNLPVGTPI